MTSVSVIVINWNGGAFLGTCIEGLLREVTPSDEVIVVDNDSSDNSVALVRSSYPGVRLVCNERNLGYAGGANAGLQAAQGDLFIFLNPDVEVHAGWLRALKDALADEKVGVAGCKLYYPGDEIIQHAGGIINLPLATADHYGYRQRDQGQWDEAREVDYVTGAALATRRDVVSQIGYFDEGFFPAYYEEADYCFRARAAGYAVRYVPLATATHHEHAALRERSDVFHRYYHQNRVRFVLKNRGPTFFIHDFAPAESRMLTDGYSVQERMVMSQVYLASMLAWPSLCWDWYPHRAKEPEGDAVAVIEALAWLRGQVRGS